MAAGGPPTRLAPQLHRRDERASGLLDDEAGRLVTGSRTRGEAWGERRVRSEGRVTAVEDRGRFRGGPAPVGAPGTDVAGDGEAGRGVGASRSPRWGERVTAAVGGRGCGRKRFGAAHLPLELRVPPPKRTANWGDAQPGGAAEGRRSRRGTGRGRSGTVLHREGGGGVSGRVQPA